MCVCSYCQKKFQIANIFLKTTYVQFTARQGGERKIAWFEFNPDNSGVEITLTVFGSALFLEHEIDIKLYKLQHESGKFEDKIAPILKQLSGGLLQNSSDISFNWT